VSLWSLRFETETLKSPSATPQSCVDSWRVIQCSFVPSVRVSLAGPPARIIRFRDLFCVAAAFLFFICVVFLRNSLMPSQFLSRAGAVAGFLHKYRREDSLSWDRVEVLCVLRCRLGCPMRSLVALAPGAWVFLLFPFPFWSFLRPFWSSYDLWFKSCDHLFRVVLWCLCSGLVCTKVCPRCSSLYVCGARDSLRPILSISNQMCSSLFFGLDGSPVVALCLGCVVFLSVSGLFLPGFLEYDVY